MVFLLYRAIKSIAPVKKYYWSALTIFRIVVFVSGEQECSSWRISFSIGEMESLYSSERIKSTVVSRALHIWTRVERDTNWLNVGIPFHLPIYFSIDFSMGPCGCYSCNYAQKN